MNKDIKLMTVEEVAELLRISKQSVYRLTDQRKIAFYKIGSRLRFAEKDVMHYIDSARVAYDEFLQPAEYQPPSDVNAKKKVGYLTTKEVAKLFGTTEQRVTQMLQSGMIGCIKTNGRLLFYKPDMEVFLKEQMKRPEDERFYLNRNKSNAMHS